MSTRNLTTYVGHASIATTMDIYGLTRGSEDEAVGLIDAYLARSDTATDSPPSNDAGTPASR